MRFGSEHWVEQKLLLVVHPALHHILVILGYPLQLETFLFIALSLPTHETVSALYLAGLQLSVVLQGRLAS